MSMKEQVGCVEAATTIVGDKWTPHLLRHFLTAETLRFCELQNKTTGINPRTLSARLVHLEENGIIKKLGDGRSEYVLTQKGRDFLPVLRAMEDWSQKHAWPSGRTQKQSIDLKV